MPETKYLNLILDMRLSYPLGNVIKYLYRCTKKGQQKADIDKALSYLPYCEGLDEEQADCLHEFVEGNTAYLSLSQQTAFHTLIGWLHLKHCDYRYKDPTREVLEDFELLKSS